MDQNQTQAAASRLATKLEALDLDDERNVLLAILGAGAASVEPPDEVAGFAVDAFIWFTPGNLAPGTARADESPKESVTFEYGGLVMTYQQQQRA